MENNKNNFLNFIYKYYPYIIISLISIFIVTFFATSSFLYTMNPWDDVSCYYAVAKALNSGKVLYKEIYEQKGPYMYFLYQVFLMFNKTGFTGLYIGELIIAVSSAIICYKTITLISNNKLKGIIISIFTIALYFNSFSYYLGGSSEEMVLPLLFYTNYLIFRMIIIDDLKYKQGFLLGVICGIIFLVKFSIALVVAFAILALVINFFFKKEFKKGIYFGLYSLLGFIIAFFPYFIYLIITNSFKDFYIAYIYNNLFVYTWSTTFDYLIKRFFKNNIFSYFSLLGVLLYLIRLDYSYKKKICYLIYLFSLLLCSFKRGMLWYYSQIMIICIPQIGLFLYNNKDINLNIRCIIQKSLVLVTSLILIFTYLFIDQSNMYYIKYDKSHYPYFKMAEIINNDNIPSKDKTLLSYYTMDNDLYLIADIYPNVKYFSYLNIFNNLEEARKAQDDYIKNHEITYVFTEYDYSYYSLFKDYNLIYADNEYNRYLFKLKDIYLK